MTLFCMSVDLDCFLSTNVQCNWHRDTQVKLFKDVIEFQDKTKSSELRFLKKRVQFLF